MHVRQLLVRERPDPLTVEGEGVFRRHRVVKEPGVTILREHPRLDRHAVVVAHALHGEARHAQRVQPRRDRHRLAPECAAHPGGKVGRLHPQSVRDHLIARRRHHLHLHRRLVGDVVDHRQPVVPFVRPVVGEERTVAVRRRSDVQAVGRNAVVRDSDGEMGAICRRAWQLHDESVISVPKRQRLPIKTHRADTHTAPAARITCIRQIEDHLRHPRRQHPESNPGRADDPIRAVRQRQRKSIVIHIDRLPHIRIGAKRRSTNAGQGKRG